ncbi:MAG: transporter suffix domain-containing protein [Myxococcota bacterium]
MNEPEAESAAPEPRKASPWSRLGGGLIMLSFLLWVPLPAIPFLSMATTDKALLGGGLAVSAEVAFWGGALLAGPEAARRARSWWRRREKGSGSPSIET